LGNFIFIYMIIYKTTNLVNGKFYIGKDAKNKKSYLGSGNILKEAIKKYGKENFKKEILEVCTSLEELSEREKYWIEKLDAINLGYNLTEGGTGGDTYTHNTNKYTAGFYKGMEPWNKGKQGIQAWNKGLKGVMTANKTTFKAGKEHTFYGLKQKESTVTKRVNTRRQNGSYKGVGKFAPKQVLNTEDGNIFNSIKDAAEYYNISRDKVGHSCRNQTNSGKFRFV
jgi:group I intron endonuclease